VRPPTQEWGGGGFGTEVKAWKPQY